MNVDPMYLTAKAIALSIPPSIIKKSASKDGIIKGSVLSKKLLKRYSFLNIYPCRVYDVIRQLTKHNRLKCLTPNLDSHKTYIIVRS
jgi:hypothetical protein